MIRPRRSGRCAGLFAALCIAGAVVTPGRAKACGAQKHAEASKALDHLANRQAWGEVERAFRAMVRAGCEPNFDALVQGATAARYLGKTLEMYERLVGASRVDPDRPLPISLERLDRTYGRVQIASGGRAAASLVRLTPTPDQEQRKSVEWADVLLGGTGSFTGMIPVGEYRVGQTTFTVEPGPGWDLVSVNNANPVIVDKPPLIKYAAPVLTAGWNVLHLGEPTNERLNPDGSPQFPPGATTAPGFAVQGGVELGLSYRAPETGIAGTLTVTGATNGEDDLLLFTAGIPLVVRPGDLRIAIGPAASYVAGQGRGVSKRFDLGQNSELNPRDRISWTGHATMGGAQGSVGVALSKVARRAQATAEISGAWQTDLTRDYYVVGLKVGVIPAIPRFEQ